MRLKSISYLVYTKGKWSLPYRLAALLLSVMCLCGGFSIIPPKRQPLVLTSHPCGTGNIENQRQQQHTLDYCLQEGGIKKISRGAKSTHVLCRQQLNNVTDDDAVVSTRRVLLLTTLMSTASLLSLPSDASDLPWEVSPVNKRYGVTVFDAEQMGYNVRFVTYLSRFLLNFDADCQRWWFARAADIPRDANLAKVADLR